MGQRLQLQSLLESIIGPEGKAYFQPPENIKMSYPAIVYRRDYVKNMFADNKPYRNTKRYEVTVIDRDPDSLIPDKVAALPLCEFSKHFVVDNLNHDIYSLYF